MTKCFSKLFDQGHRLTSRGQRRIFKVTANWRHGSACNGDFARFASKKRLGLGVTKYAMSICTQKNRNFEFVKILKILKNIFKNLDFGLRIWILCITCSKKVYYLHPQNIDTLLPGGL